MSAAETNIDFGAILHLAVLGASSDDYLPILGKLPCWWVEELGVSDGAEVAIHSAFLVDFLSDARDVWNSSTNRTLQSPLFEVGDRDVDWALVQAIAVCHGGQKLLILRNLNTSDKWLSPVLQAARSKMVQHEKDRHTHAKEIAHISADRDEAQRREQLKSRVLANLSHEIRTPLTTILGMTNIVRESAIPEQKDFINAISSAANQMLMLGNDILDLSKMQAERLELDCSDFDLHAFMNDLNVQWQMHAKERDIEFECILGENLQVRVKGDEFRLRQVLSNLIGNAMKFTEEGRVTLSATPSSKDPSKVRFSVRDTGVGISAEDVPLIFEAFAQVDVSKRRRHEGAGLGLAIAGRLVRLMGGEIEVETEIGSGSHFWFDARLQPSSDRKGKLSDLQGTPDCSGIRVLVAEDHALNRSIIVGVLTSAGGTVTDVENGEDAVKAWGDGGFDVIVMDCQMPVMDGMTAIATIRNREYGDSKVPIIALTAHSSREDQAEIMSRGANRCMSKPFESEELIRTVIELARH